MVSSTSLAIKRIAEDFSIDRLDDPDPAWNGAPQTLISKYWSGKPAAKGREFSARLLWSDTALYVRFDCRQSEPLVVNEHPQTANKTPRLWERDVCELFIASNKADPRRYAEFEIAPTGEWLDLFVDWTKEKPRDWEYSSGMEAFASIQPEKVVMVMKIPWTAFDSKPKPGDVWAGNLFRQVGSGDTRGYLAWQPTETPGPQFHVPDKFGQFEFQGRDSSPQDPIKNMR